MKPETLSDCLEYLQAKAEAQRIQWSSVERLYIDLLSEWKDDELAASIVFGSVRNSRYLPDVSELEDSYLAAARQKHGPAMWGKRDKIKYPDSKQSWHSFRDGFLDRWRELNPDGKPLPEEQATLFRDRYERFEETPEHWMIQNAVKVRKRKMLNG